MVNGNRSSSVIITLLVLLVLQQVIIDTSNAEFTNNSRNNCSDSSSSIGECNEEEEKLMDSEVSRRFLASVQGISYGALKGDIPACGSGEHKPKRADCNPMIAANPHVGGCFKVYRCRSGSQSPGSN
ncbi:rapid alkalinization factor-like [Papaver somniferum]|uniref:rapid alkalinization factor-like n=1 Tax=Papaver somniferum TaxID=3469 RepID=UPI000E6FC4C5|nr:rapid alkalinization factor-like [Papaver somniferum]